MALGIGQQAHGCHRGFVADDAKRIRAFFQNLPGQMRYLATGQPGHQRVDITRHCRQAARLGALREAVGLIGFNHHKDRTITAITLPEISTDSSRQPAYASLHKNMRRPLGQLLRGLLHHQLIALHHIARYIHVAGVRGIGDHKPPLGFGVRIGLAHSIVIVTRSAHHLRAILSDSLFAPFAHRRVDIDHTLAGKQLSAPGHRAAMIAIGGAGYCHALAQRPHIRRQQVLRRKRAPQPRPQFTAQQPRHGVSTAQRFEATQAEAPTFIFVMHAAHTQRLRQCRQAVQRCLSIALPLR